MLAGLIPRLLKKLLKGRMELYLEIESGIFRNRTGDEKMCIRDSAGAGPGSVEKTGGGAGVIRPLHFLWQMSQKIRMGIRMIALSLIHI